MFLVAGLGNPEDKYLGTRHNAGFDVIDYISRKLSFDINKQKFKGLVGEYVINNEKVFFLKPLTYMNLSGESIQELSAFYKIPVENIIVIYDDIAMDVGRIRIRESGRDGGHNGMKSIISCIGSDKFPRVRVGIGAPREDLISHVLGKFTKEERILLEESIEKACEAVLCIIQKDVQSSMNMYNSFKAGQK